MGSSAGDRHVGLMIRSGLSSRGWPLFWTAVKVEWSVTLVLPGTYRSQFRPSTSTVQAAPSCGAFARGVHDHRHKSASPSVGGQPPRRPTLLPARSVRRPRRDARPSRGGSTGSRSSSRPSAARTAAPHLAGSPRQAAEIIIWNGIPLVTSSSRARKALAAHRDHAAYLTSINRRTSGKTLGDFMPAVAAGIRAGRLSIQP
jgi:hypothetical protein